MTWTPDEANQVKDARRGVVDQPAGRGKKRQGKKSVIVEYRYPESGIKALRAWAKFGAYPDIETAQEVVANKTRSATTAEYRIKT